VKWAATNVIPVSLTRVFRRALMWLVKMRDGKRLGVMAIFAFVVALGAGRGRAEERNKCGCYKDGATCYCDKKAKCGCPGECEPKGCEEKRERDLQKEIEAETKKASAGKQKAGEANGDNGEAEKPAKAKAGKGKLSAAQTKELAKLIDLFLADHPDARGRSLEDVRNDLNP
jgi:hypothetical protein